MKRGKSPYHYIELMACPKGWCDSVVPIFTCRVPIAGYHPFLNLLHALIRVLPGCNNGGAQLKVEEDVDLFTKVEAVYHEIPLVWDVVHDVGCVSRILSCFSRPMARYGSHSSQLTCTLV